MEILLSPPVLLTLAVIFVNGWTDAPNAIATAVGTGALRMGRAIALAAVCNLLGAVLSAALCPAVAATVLEIGDFSGRAQAQAALCAALLSIVLWAVAAWAFGIPTSESHALLAALSGAAVALQGTPSGANAAAWGKVWWGLLLSVLLGLVLGGGLCVLMRLFLGRGCLERAAQRFRHWQDGQQFLGVLLLAEALRAGRPPQLESAPLWEALLCALVMGAGTAVGGRRIIRAVGQDMTPLMPYQGFAADTAAVACLLLATAGGLPVSTTHTKTCAVMGAGAAGGGKVDRRIAGRMVLAWLLTFPACALLGYVLSKWMFHLA